MVEPHCIFCRIIGGEEMVSLVHEDDRTLAFLDIQPMSKGHTLIVTKDHYETLFDLPEDLAAHCLAVARRIAPGIKRAMKAQAINIFSANGSGRRPGRAALPPAPDPGAGGRAVRAAAAHAGRADPVALGAGHHGGAGRPRHPGNGAV
jgi:hypothetical protein